jgi:hypothetical protein
MQLPSCPAAQLGRLAEDRFLSSALLAELNNAARHAVTAPARGSNTTGDTFTKGLATTATVALGFTSDVVDDAAVVDLTVTVFIVKGLTTTNLAAVPAIAGLKKIGALMHLLATLQISACTEPVRTSRSHTRNKKTA